MTLKCSILLSGALGGLLACGTASADVIHLKDGRQITAKILKHTEDRITIDWFGTPLTYWLAEIERIDERDSPVVIPSIRERPARADALAPTPPVDETAADRAQLITRVLYLSGLAQQIEQMPVQAAAQLDERDEEETEGLSAEARGRLRQIVAEAFGREAMYQSAVGTFTKWFDQDRFQQILEWLESPLTQKITQVEVEAPDQEAMEEFVSELRQQRPDPARVDLVKRLDVATGATDLSLEVMHAVMTGMRDISDMPGSAPLADAATVGRTKELDKALYKTQYRSAIQANAVIQFLFVYRNIPDDELAQYVEFWESDLGRWFARVIVEALVDATTTASSRMATRVVMLGDALSHP